MENKCSFNNCNNKLRAKNFCNGHYMQYKYGDSLKPLRKRSSGYSKNKLCTVTNCNEKHKALGYCDKHYTYIKKYNLSPDEYFKILKKQNLLCAICNEEKFLVVDHNHKNGEVRGLLCNKCNIGLGHFNDNVSLLNSAIKYVS